MFAPIMRSGSIMRPIGRREREPSPTNRLSKGLARENPGEQPHGRAGVAAIDLARGAVNFRFFP